jgi:hypothetical protein
MALTHAHSLKLLAPTLVRKQLSYAGYNIYGPGLGRHCDPVTLNI